VKVVNALDETQIKVLCGGGQCWKNFLTWMAAAQERYRKRQIKLTTALPTYVQGGVFPEFGCKTTEEEAVKLVAIQLGQLQPFIAKDTTALSGSALESSKMKVLPGEALLAPHYSELCMAILMGQPEGTRISEYKGLKKLLEFMTNYVATELRLPQVVGAHLEVGDVLAPCGFDFSMAEVIDVHKEEGSCTVKWQGWNNRNNSELQAGQELYSNVILLIWRDVMALYKAWRLTWDQPKKTKKAVGTDAELKKQKKRRAAAEARRQEVALQKALYQVGWQLGPHAHLASEVMSKMPDLVGLEPTARLALENNWLEVRTEKFRGIELPGACAKQDIPIGTVFLYPGRLMTDAEYKDMIRIQDELYIKQQTTSGQYTDGQALHQPAYAIFSLKLLRYNGKPYTHLDASEIKPGDANDGMARMVNHNRTPNMVCCIWRASPQDRPHAAYLVTKIIKKGTFASLNYISGGRREGVRSYEWLAPTR